MNTPTLCPCGSAQPYQHCCEPLHSGVQKAGSPEALMRSRYCAFVLGLGEYLFNSWHPAFVGSLTVNELSKQETEWDHLDILGSGERADQGWVEFKAWYRDNNRLDCLHERSRFVRTAAGWLYTDGDIMPAAPKSGRNDPCPCGSGKKFKKCCG